MSTGAKTPDKKAYAKAQAGLAPSYTKLDLYPGRVDTDRDHVAPLFGSEMYTESAMLYGQSQYLPSIPPETNIAVERRGKTSSMVKLHKYTPQLRRYQPRVAQL